MTLPTITSVTNLGVALENFKQDAKQIASITAKGGEDTTDLAEALVDLNTDQTQIEASVKVVQAIDETLGTIINLKA